jgi:hypothetical protein
MCSNIPAAPAYGVVTLVEKDEKSLQRGGDSDYDKRNILVVICETDIP